MEDESTQNNEATAEAAPISQGEAQPQVTSDEASLEAAENLERILDLKILVTVNIGSVRMTLQDLIAIQPGAIIEVQKNVDEPLPLTTNNNRKKIGQGQVVAIGENLGIRILESEDHPVSRA